MLSLGWEQVVVPRRAKGGKAEDRPYPNVAKALIGVRKSLGLTQEEMAPRIGLTLAGYRPYEQGKRNLSQDQIRDFAKALGLPITAITSRLWPEDTKLVVTRYPANLDEIMQRTENLPPVAREKVIRGYLASLDIAEVGDLARRN